MKKKIYQSILVLMFLMQQPNCVGQDLVTLKNELFTFQKSLQDLGFQLSLLKKPISTPPPVTQPVAPPASIPSMPLQQQGMVPYSLWQQVSVNPRADKVQLFKNSVQQGKQSNAAIPTKNNNIFRIMTYNVHYWVVPGGGWQGADNFQAMFDVIQKLNPDVLILQEVRSRGGNFVKSATKVQLNKLGYDHVAACNTFPREKGKAWFGNIIASKIKPTEIARKNFNRQERPGQEDRCYSQMALTLPNRKQILLYGTHLEVGQNDVKGRQPQSEDIRLAQVKQITESIEFERSKKQIDNILIAADFNSVRQQDYDYQLNGQKVWNLIQQENQRVFGFYPTPTKVLDFLTKAGFVDSFSYLNWQGPKFTTWTGTVIDFIFLAPTWNLPLAGSYVYYDAASDHLPIIMDIKLN